MHVHILNDTSSFHAGSLAVIEALKLRCGQGRGVSFSSTPRLEPCPPGAIEACDVLVVNGEGAMQEEAQAWSQPRVLGLMHSLEQAKRMGKRAYLINTVWHRMGSHWGPTLASLDGVAVREPASAHFMFTTTGFLPRIYPDLSLSCPIDPLAPATDFNGTPVMGVIYRHNTPRWRRFTHKHAGFAALPFLGLGGSAEGLNAPANWSSVVRSLQSAELYITGQHHGVLAACKARTPFVACKLHNHKIASLRSWSGFAFPIACSRREIFAAVAWARAHRDAYQRFFDWMERLPAWPGLGDNMPTHQYDEA